VEGNRRLVGLSTDKKYSLNVEEIVRLVELY